MIMKKKQTFFKSINIPAVVILTLAPLVSVLIQCAFNGISPADIYLPATQWNDEAIYYKIVGGVAACGVPQGFFGFNQSHALVGSFAAWSPVLVLHYALYAFIFGWNYFSPLICNIVFMSLAFAAFALITRIDTGRAAAVGLLFAAMQLITRYMLSAMSETFFFALIIVYIAAALRLKDGAELPWLKALLMALAVLLSAARPFFMPLVFLAGYYIFRKSKLTGIIIAAVMLVLAAAAYFAVSKYFTAPYFSPVVHNDIASEIASGGIWHGVMYVLSSIKHDIAEFFRLLAASFTHSEATNVPYLCWTVLTVIFACFTAHYAKRKDKENIIFSVFMLLWFLSLLAAVMLFSDFPVGSRHALTYILAGIPAALALADSRWLKAAVAVALAAVFAWSSAAMFTDSYYDLPRADTAFTESIETAQRQMADGMSLSSGGIGWDNTVAWIYADDAGETRVTDFSRIYAVPDGFGINMIILGDGESPAALLTKYIYTYPGGEVAAALEEAGAVLLCHDSAYALYLNPRCNDR